MDSDTAASDLIATVALIAIFVTGAAIAGVALLSHPPGDAAPAMIARNVADGEKLYIYHEGGDPLEREHFEILVYGVRQTGNITLINASGYESKDWTTWKTGEALNLSDVTRGLPENPRIQIVGEGVGRTGSDWLLHEIGEGAPGTATPEPTPTTEPLTADFTANITEGNAPLAVQFSDTSTGNPSGWLWNFGDGNTSTEQNPIHTYESPGTYTVSLNASNDYGFSIETKIDYITVLEPPVVAFTADPTEGNAPLTVQFTDASAGNVTVWLWDFGDGNTSTEQNPIHTYIAPGNYTVSLNASNDYGFSIETKIEYITVLEPPVAAFTADPTEGNAPLTVQFNDGSAGNVTVWLWDFGDGNTSTEQNPSHTYESPGTYTVNLTVSNAYSEDTETRTNYITVLEPPEADFTANPTEGNTPLIVQFIDESAGNVTAWAWDFGDGSTSTEQNPSHTYVSAGTYSVTLNASNAYGYSISAPTTVTVLEPPEADFTADPTEGNAPLSVQFTDESTGNVTAWAWDFGDGSTSTDQHPSHTYVSAGTYSVTLNASNAYGYNISAPTTITVLEPPLAAFTTTPTEGNAPLTVQFTDESTGNVTSWQWDFGDGNTSTEQSPSHTYVSAGNYTATLNASNTYGYSISAPTTVTVLEPPEADFIADPTEGNAPLTVQFTDESAGNVTSWQWDFGDGNTSTEQNPSYTYVSAGIYTVSLNASNDYGFSIKTKTEYITVLEPPVAAFTATPTEGNAPLTVQFIDESTGDVTTWHWDFGDENTSTGQNPGHTYVTPGTYTVSLTVSNAYSEDTETRTDYITVLEPPEADFTATPTKGNAPLTVQFTDESAGNVTAWAWDFGDGNTSTDQSPSHTYVSAGTYSVTLNASNAYGYSISAPITITVLEPPVAAFTADPTEGNAPLIVQFTDESTGDVTAWAWDFGDGNTSAEQDPIHTYESPGTYSVTLNASNAYGYSISAPITITVLEPPVAAFTADVTEGNAPLSVQFTDESTGNVTAWHWDFGDGNTSTDQHPSHTYTIPGNYTVSFTVSNAYSEDTETRTNYITVLEPPEADFIADPTEGNAPLTVQFADESAGNVTARHWDFGDGNTSTEQNPSHIYMSAGIYTASLNASNDYGFSIKTKTEYITVLEPPVAAFTATPTEGNAPLTVQFTDESAGNVTARHWDFGDGNTSTEQNPNHTYTIPGNYTATLNASNAYGYSISAPTTITVLEPPEADFTATPTEGNAPLTVQFTDLSTGNVTAWAWDFGDGNTSTEQNPSHTYTIPGNYTVSLTVSNAYSEDTETRTNYITVLEPPEANFIADPTEGNAPLMVQFTDESVGNVTARHWDFGDGNRSTEQSPSHTYTIPGNYTVSLTVSNAYSEDTETRTNYITVLEPPEADFIADPTEGNAPLTVQFTDESAGNVTAWAWDFGDGSTSIVQHPIHTYVSAGTYTVVLNASNTYGFSTKTKTEYITVLEPPAANFTANVTEGNAPLAVQFNDTSTGNPSEWFWDFGDGNTSIAQHPIHTYESPGNYTVSLTAKNAYGNNTHTRPDYIWVTEKSFIDNVIDENVFVYGTILSITGSASVTGEGATVVITEGLNLGGSSGIAVSNIYVNGSVTSIGSSSFGPPNPPGKICINGDLTLTGGDRDVYGDIYVNGNFDFAGGTINRNVYVGGDLTLGWGARFADGAHIYYTGTNKTPSGINCDSCTPNATYPGFTMPNLEIPPTKPEEWYEERGYVKSGTLTSNMKIFADSYSSTSWRPTATDVIIIARDGDITITGMGNSNVTGVFFAPNGRVTFSGKSLEGVVIARDGFFVESGNTVVIFKNIEEYITDPEDYPF